MTQVKYNKGRQIGRGGEKEIYIGGWRQGKEE